MRKKRCFILIVVPAIDILGGRVVRLSRGKEETARVYSGDPLEVARSFMDAGARIIHLVDLDAAIRGDVTRNNEIVRRILSTFQQSNLAVQVAGGIRNEQRASELIGDGASRIVLGSLVFESLELTKLILHLFGTGKIVIALDYDESGLVRTNGWKEKANQHILDCVRTLNSLGFSMFLATCIARDGMLRGPDIRTLREIRNELPRSARLIASGGVASERDLGTLSKLRIDEVIVGKAIYEGTISKSLLSKIYV